MLEAAARHFKVDPKGYSITTGRDGTPRILHGDRQYNLGDFFTKHLGIPWTRAQAVLREAYQQTLSDGLPPPDKELWRSFGAWRGQSMRERRERVERAKADARARLVQAREAYKSARVSAQGRRGAERIAALAAPRAERVLAEQAWHEAIVASRERARVPSRNAQYREFLTSLASQGHLGALAELRRAATIAPDPFDGVIGAKGRAVFPLPSYKVDHQGRVTYYRAEQSIVSDTARGVEVLHREAAAYDTALKVAVARYGRELTLRGDEAFVAAMVQAARRSGLPLTLRDAARPRAAPLALQAPQRGR